MHRADGDVLADREAAKGLHDLESARDAVVGDYPRAQPGDVTATDQDLAGGGPQVACDEIYQRALARPVGTDDSEDLAL